MSLRKKITHIKVRHEPRNWLTIGFVLIRQGALIHLRFQRPDFVSAPMIKTNHKPVHGRRFIRRSCKNKKLEEPKPSFQSETHVIDDTCPSDALNPTFPHRPRFCELNRLGIRCGDGVKYSRCGIVCRK